MNSFLLKSWAKILLFINQIKRQSSDFYNLLGIKGVSLAELFILMFVDGVKGLKGKFNLNIVKNIINKSFLFNNYLFIILSDRCFSSFKPVYETVVIIIVVTIFIVAFM